MGVKVAQLGCRNRFSESANLSPQRAGNRNNTKPRYQSDDTVCLCAGHIFMLGRTPTE